MQQPERSRSESYYWPTILAVGLHVVLFGMLFVSFAMTPELPPSKPFVQATLYQLKSQSQAKTQTNQKIAGEAQKTAAKQYEAEQMEQRKVEQQKQVAAKAAEQKKAEEARKVEAAKAAAAKAEAEKKAAEAKKADETKKAEQQKQADIAKKKAAEEEAKKKAAEDAKKKAAAEEAKKKAAAEEAKKKAAEEAKKKAAAEAAKKKAAEDAKKKAAEAARKAAEDKKAQALAELLSDDTQRQQAMADTQGDQTSGNFDDLIRIRAAEGWSRPPSARNNMSVSLRVNMLPDGTITAVTVSRSSGDAPFDNSAVAAVKNIGRLTEMQGLTAQEFQPYRSFTMTFTPEDLAL